MKISVILLLLFCFAIHAQTVKEINNFIGLPDSLYKTEIRIYKKYSLSNGAEIFRLYESKDNGWYAEMYYYYDEVEGEVETNFKKEELKNYDDFEVLWLQITNAHALYLPEWDKIQYKLGGEWKIECDVYVVFIVQLKVG